MRQAGCEAGHWLRQAGFTVLGGCGEPWLHWCCAGGLWGALASLVLCWGLWGALASLVLCWGAVGSPGFAGTVLGVVESPGFTGAVLGGLWGALASLVLHWWGCGSPGVAGKRQAAPVKVPGGWALGKSFLSVPNVANTVFQCRFIRNTFLSVPNVANTVFQCRFIRNTFLHVPFEIMMISKVLNVV